MKTTISNQIIIENPNQEIIDWVEKNLVVVNPTYATLKRLGKDDTIKWKHIPEKMMLYSIRGNRLFIPFGVLNSIWGMIKKDEYNAKFNDNGVLSCSNDVITQPLFDYQEEAVQAILSAKGGVLVGGCGSGKTNAGIEILHRLNKKFLWLTHTHDLLKQTIKRMNFLYPNLKVGTITEGKIDIGEDGAVATVQTLANIDPEIYKDFFDVVIVDECHHISGSPTLLKYFMKIINVVPARYKIGLTATPSRGDTMIKSMYAYIGCNQSGQFEPVITISRSKIKTMTATHVLSPLETKMSYDALNTDGTFDYLKLIDFLSNDEERNKSILRNIEESATHFRKQLVLCSRVSQCEELYQKLLDKGISAALLVGKVSDKKREVILNSGVNNWDVLVASYALAKEGLDIPTLDTLHLVTPQKDKALVIQSVGRIERFVEGKPQPIVYDYVDVNIPYCLGAYKKRKNFIAKRA